MAAAPQTRGRRYRLRRQSAVFFHQLEQKNINRPGKAQGIQVQFVLPGAPANQAQNHKRKANPEKGQLAQLVLPVHQEAAKHKQPTRKSIRRFPHQRRMQYLREQRPLFLIFCLLYFYGYDDQIISKSGEKCNRLRRKMPSRRFPLWDESEEAAEENGRSMDSTGFDSNLH